MVKAYKREKIVFFTLFVILGFLCNIFFAGKKSPDNDVISASLSANYIALLLNNSYILYMYFKTKKINYIYDKIVCRIGQKKFFNIYILNSILDILLYNFITYFIIYLKLGINIRFIAFFLTFLAVNLLNFFLQELVSTLVFFTQKGSKYIIYPVIMNLLFHYYMIPLLITIFSKHIGGI